MQSDSKLLSGFTWHINGNADNNLESLCIIREIVVYPKKKCNLFIYNLIISYK
jgi:hypothetical protein